MVRLDPLARRVLMEPMVRMAQRAPPVQRVLLGRTAVVEQSVRRVLMVKTELMVRPVRPEPRALTGPLDQRDHPGRMVQTVMRVVLVRPGLPVQTVQLVQQEQTVQPV